MKYIVSLNGKDYEVEVEKGEATLLSVNNTSPALANKAQTTVAPVVAATPTQEPAPAAISAEDEVVKSPMPGTIININVEQGTSIKKGDVIMILEAMKMENELVAPFDGTIKQLLVIKGAKVSTGDALFVIG